MRSGFMASATKAKDFTVERISKYLEASTDKALRVGSRYVDIGISSDTYRARH